MIAVQIANGTFVPVLDTSSKKRRRLVVTTVRDGQTDVRIELYRGSDPTMADAHHVGSLLIGNIEPAESGTPDIAVLLGVDEAGNLNATATDTRSGEYQSLSVNLGELIREGGYDVPDFQLSDDELTMEELSMEEGPGDDLETFSFDELEDEGDLPTGEESASESLTDLDVPSEPELDAESELESLEELDVTSEDPDTLEEIPVTSEDPDGLEESTASSDEPDALVDLADEEFSFDDSFGEEVLDEFGQDEAAEPPADDSSFVTNLDHGLVEADLGDEDFTFDEGGDFEAPPVSDQRPDDDEEGPLFGVPEASGDEIDDTLTPEEFDRLDSEPVRTAGAPTPELPDEEIRPRRSNAIIFIGYLFLALAAIGVLTYLVFRLLEGPPTPPLRAGHLGEVSVALLLLSIPARRISDRLGRRRDARRTLRTKR